MVRSGTSVPLWAGVFAVLVVFGPAWAGGGSYTCVDLNPTGFASTYGYGISSTQQVGYGWGMATGGNSHALLWTGTAASAVDLHPSGFYASYATGTNGTQQVGWALPTGGGQPHAMLWTGTSDSVLDLQQFLPSGFTGSEALGIDEQGNVVGFATNDLGSAQAVPWQVPEPASAILLSIGAAMVAVRRRKA